ncbi:ABC transporter permease [Ruficoccus amylovorans]|uniref:Transport permease protein n=2 Tax=Ruficoccus amylovorans TaxID=1804625 RepID=A0A842HFI2_9BACT|nr:ABC transporter permease [Ruficoccus amylovorans]
MLEKGQVREAGPPEHFHRLVQGRVFVLQPAAHVNPRLLQSAALTHQSVLDATIRSGKVRCVLAEGALHPWEEKEPGKLVAQVEAATPNFEDAFMALSQHQHAVLPKGRRPWEILVGKAIPGIAFGLIDRLLLSLAAVYWFGLPFRGTFLALLLALLLFFISIVGVGLLISSLCMTMQQGLLGAFIFIMPSVILSGFATPIANMPIWLQYVTLANPLRYAVDALRIIFLQGADMGGTWHLLWPLILISLITLPLAPWMFRLRSE